MLKCKPMMCALLLTLVLAAVSAWGADRMPVEFPDLPGYVTLKCDFHMHTVYSDGTVLPHIRVREAWRDGLDAMAISEHVEHKDRPGDVNKSDINRSYDLAKPEAARYGILLIRGAEITRNLPHGHFNAIGIADCNPLNAKDDFEAVKQAVDQGGFVFWNHPPSNWSEIQQDYLERGWVQGVEVFNGGRYYPHSFAWCLEKDLAVISNTDVHGLISEQYDTNAGRCRTMTLVFAEDRSEKGVLDALRARRTVAFAQNTLAGRREWVEPLFHGCIEVLQPEVRLEPGRETVVAVRNHSPVTFELEADGRADGVQYPGALTLPARKTAALTLKPKGSATPGETADVALPYVVTNAWIGVDKQGLATEIPLRVHFAEN